MKAVLFTRRVSCYFARVSLTLILCGCNSQAHVDTELSQARQLWATRGPSDYRFTITRSCECLREMRGPVVVIVRNGRIASREYLAGGIPVTQYAALFTDVPGLFQQIVEARREGAERVDVRYDPALGYPVRIALDYSSKVADDEFVYVAEDFRAF